jgi:hypothetical protein
MIKPALVRIGLKRKKKDVKYGNPIPSGGFEPLHPSTRNMRMQRVMCHEGWFAYHRAELYVAHRVAKAHSDDPASGN